MPMHQQPSEPERTVDSVSSRKVLAVVALLALIGCFGAISTTREQHRPNRRVAGANAADVDLSWDGKTELAQHHNKPLSLVKGEDEHDGTHTLVLGHGGVEFGGMSSAFNDQFMAEPALKATMDSMEDVSLDGDVIPAKRVDELNANSLVAYPHLVPL